MKVAIELNDLVPLPAGLSADLHELNQLLAGEDVSHAMHELRRIAEKAAQLLCRTHDGSWGDAKPTLERTIEALKAAEHPPEDLVAWLLTIQSNTGAGSHDPAKTVTESQVRAAAAALEGIVRWVANSPAQQTATRSAGSLHASQSVPDTIVPVPLTAGNVPSPEVPVTIPTTQVPSGSRPQGTVRSYKVGDEPIKDYRLVRFLGRGGFGQVWKAVGPGRTEVAMKIIDLRDKNGLHEFESLRHVKGIRHTNLIDVQAIWLKGADGQTIDEQDVCWHDTRLRRSEAAGEQAMPPPAEPVELLVAMKLGDASLAQRLKEIDDTATGIPLDELLRYLEDTAKGIDFLNQRKQIIHGDIKPGNLLIVGDSAAVCDFGLARVAESLRRTSGINCTPAYAAPESIKGKPTLKTDQYALAIAYLELRTGNLPFAKSASHMQIMEAHINGTLDLSQLPPPEREVIRRGTSVNPDKRWTDCREMMQALRKAVAPPAPRARPLGAIVAATIAVLAILAIGWFAIPSRVWLPSADFVAIEAAPWGKIQGMRLSPRIAREFPDGSRVELVLVHREGMPPFYVMDTRVSNKLFGRFAVATTYAWNAGGHAPHESLTGVPASVAESFADWFAAGQLGHLPTVRQWNAAAGLSEATAAGNNLFADARADSKEDFIEWTRDAEGFEGATTVPVENANDQVFVLCRGRSSFADPAAPIGRPYNPVASSDHSDIGFRVVVELPTN